MGIIKEEMYRLKTYTIFEELAHDIKQYIEFYNTKQITLKMGLKLQNKKKPCMKGHTRHKIFCLPDYLTGAVHFGFCSFNFKFT